MTKTRWNRTRVHFGLTSPAIPLTADVVDSFLAAAEARPPTQVPTIYDLAALCDEIATSRPFQARSAKKTLHWLMKQADRIDQQEKWDHPWRKH